MLQNKVNKTAASIVLLFISSFDGVTFIFSDILSISKVKKILFIVAIILILACKTDINAKKLLNI